MASGTSLAPLHRVVPVLLDATAREALLGHLPRGGDQGARERRVLALVEALAVDAKREE